MTRMERSRRRRGEKRLRSLLLFLSALVVLAGLAGRLRGGLTLETMACPTATPVAAAFDETPESRTLTLPETAWYALQTGVFTARDTAQQCADMYTDRGAPGLAVRIGDTYRVFIACYARESDAAAVRERLAREQQVETSLYPWVLEGVSLRISGMAGQLDVAQSGLALADQAAERLRSAAQDLDAMVLTLPQVRTLIAEVDAAMTLWAQTARSRFPGARPDVISQVLDITQNWSAVLPTLTAAENDAAALSASMKLEAMRLYARSAALRAYLTAG